MSGVIEVKVNNEVVYFEDAKGHMDDTEEVGGLSDLEARAAGSLDRAMQSIKNVASSTIKHIRELDDKIAPDEFELEFGVKISAEYGAVITKTTGEGHLKVTLTYKRGHPK